MSQRSSAPPVMAGLELPDVDQWSERVFVALGQNPSAFTGPGTNTYLVGSGARRILVDTGSGRDSYLPVLQRAIAESGCEGLQEIVLTHGHPDHFGGVRQILDVLGEVEVKKYPWPDADGDLPFDFTPLSDDCRIETDGATLRGIHTPGHAPDHLCFVLEEDAALISGDNVLGVGTTVIPSETGDLGEYMASLERMLAADTARIYPAHGPRIDDARAKIQEYIEHRLARDAQILAAVEEGAATVVNIVKVVYAAYPEFLHAAAGQSVTSHLLKLEREGRVARSDGAHPLEARWDLV